MRILVSVFFLLTGLVSASAQDFTAPRVNSLAPDWDAARTALAAENPTSGETASFELLNGALAQRFPGITASPVPVLLPFDTAAYLRDRTPGPAKGAESYLGPFQPSGFFLAGPTGYDAVFSARAGDFADVSFSDPIMVEVSGFAINYDIPPAKGGLETPARTLEGQYPGIRRLILESYLRYSFTRYGIRYVVSIQCFDAAPRPHRLACKQADKVATKMLQTLRLSGGNPAIAFKPFEAKTPEQPEGQSVNFTYYGPGRLIPHTGVKDNDGVVDYTVYAPIRFPIAHIPAYANSQSFMNWGDCDQTGRAPSPGGRKGAGYRCRVNSKPLVFDESAKENYSYPWRDNFCEHRAFFVGQCATGEGHQGQDIRPSSCKLRNDGADRCEPYVDDVVATMDGMILRARKQEGVFLVANNDNTRIRFRYMHMNPNRLDDDGVLSGRRVREGEVIGRIANYNRRENGTTLHLHFEAMVPTADGWVRVNPYSTLVVSYENLIGARGREVKDEPPPVAETPAAAPATATVASASPVAVIVAPEAKKPVAEAKKPEVKVSHEEERHSRRGKRFSRSKSSKSERAERPAKHRGKVRHARR